MSFKENILKKITIDDLFQKVSKTLGPVDSEKRIDREAMKHLLEMSPYHYKRERDLDLYINEDDSGKQKILVLDNDLPIYRTTVEDVVLRKSPYIKEMVSLRNMIKILNDADVVISKKEASLETIHGECINALNLSFDKADMEAITQDGISALKNGDREETSKSLLIFGELLGYKALPNIFKIADHFIRGSISTADSGQRLYGPIVIHNTTINSIKLIEEKISGVDKLQLDFFFQVAYGEKAAAKEGQQVFEFLKESVFKQVKSPAFQGDNR